MRQTTKPGDHVDAGFDWRSGGAKRLRPASSQWAWSDRSCFALCVCPTWCARAISPSKPSRSPSIKQRRPISCAGAESSRAEKSTYAEGFSQCDFKVDRAPLRDPAYRPEFPNVPLLLEEIPIVVSVEEAALLEAVKLPHCADDLGAALRDVLFSRWEERFLSASSGAPAISAPDAQWGACVRRPSVSPGRYQAPALAHNPPSAESITHPIPLHSPNAGAWPPPQPQALSTISSPPKWGCAKPAECSI